MLNVHPLKLIKSVVDPIHGLIRMTEDEHKVMNSRTFRRLREIKQNGLLHLVFPSATHTRFEHSLGVMHVADSVLQALLFNSCADSTLAEPDDQSDGRAVNFAQVEKDTLKHIFQVARLAALVHDLGHGPLSHAFDYFAPRAARIAYLIDHEPVLASLRPLRSELLHDIKDLEREPISHETMSCILLADHLHTHPPAREQAWLLQAVSAAVLGRKRCPKIPDGIPGSLRRWMPLIQDIVSSAPADADRMDYVERDSRSCGVNYGLYDRDRLLKSALCYHHKEDEYRLGWKISGLRAIEVFLHARFQLFAQIYYHKSNSAAVMMTTEMGRFAGDHNISVFVRDDLEGIVEEYCSLSDDRFLRMLCGDVDGRLQGAGKIHRVARRIAARELYKRVFESTPAISAKSMMEVLSRLHPGTGDSLKIDDSRLEATKDLEKGAVLLRRGSDGCYVAAKTEEENWLKASPLIRTLNDEERKISRVYWDGKHTDVETLEKLRTSARVIVDAEPRRVGARNER